MNKKQVPVYHVSAAYSLQLLVRTITSVLTSCSEKLCKTTRKHLR